MKQGMNTVIVGGGMITQVQILPSLYQLQRLGLVNDISICALNSAPLKVLAETESLREAYPGQNFTAYPSLDSDPEKNHPDLFKEVLDKLGPGNLVFVALPDQLHYGAVIEALKRDQHVLTVKPLVLSHKQSREIEDMAMEKGLFVGVEYHKRADDRALMARRQYRAGRFGEFMLGHAILAEPWYYRDSNFQNWCTVENSDMFSYIACHYIDQVHFITGLLPISVSVYGKIDAYPNGRDGYLYTDGRVIWENGACLNVQNALGYPNAGPGGNMQGIRMLFKGPKDAGYLEHQDQYRGVKHSYITAPKGQTLYNEPSPDYLQMIEYSGKGLEPVGYGYRSIRNLVNATLKVQQAGDLEKRRQIIKEIDNAGLLATPANSAFNELVMEAGRMSITHDSAPVKITYGDDPKVSLE